MNNKVATVLILGLVCAIVGGAFLYEDSVARQRAVEYRKYVPESTLERVSAYWLAEAIRIEADSKDILDFQRMVVYELEDKRADLEDIPNVRGNEVYREILKDKIKDASMQLIDIAKWKMDISVEYSKLPR